MPFPSLCTRWAVFRVPLAPQFYDTLPSGLCPSFGGSESIYLAPAVLPRVRHIALPGPAGRKDHPLPLLVLADALFGKELVQLSRRYAEFVSDARALEPVPVLDKLLVEYESVSSPIPYPAAWDNPYRADRVPPPWGVRVRLSSLVSRRVCR